MNPPWGTVIEWAKYKVLRTIQTHSWCSTQVSHLHWWRGRIWEHLLAKVFKAKGSGNRLEQGGWGGSSWIGRGSRLSSQQLAQSSYRVMGRPVATIPWDWMMVNGWFGRTWRAPIFMAVLALGLFFSSCYFLHNESLAYWFGVGWGFVWLAVFCFVLIFSWLIKLFITINPSKFCISCICTWFFVFPSFSPQNVF